MAPPGGLTDATTARARVDARQRDEIPSRARRPDLERIMKLILTGISTGWRIRVVSVVCQECGVKVRVAKAVVDTLADAGRVEVPLEGVDVDRLRSRLRALGVSVAGPEPSAEPVSWPTETEQLITVAEFNALVRWHLPELLQAVRDEQANVAWVDGVDLHGHEDDPTIVYMPLVFSVLPSFILAVTRPVDPDALTRFNELLMAIEERQPGLASHDLVPMWLRAHLDEVPESLRYFDAVLLGQEGDIF
jgi:hypothetical protein